MFVSRSIVVQCSKSHFKHPFTHTLFPPSSANFSLSQNIKFFLFLTLSHSKQIFSILSAVIIISSAFSKIFIRPSCLLSCVRKQRITSFVYSLSLKSVILSQSNLDGSSKYVYVYCPSCLYSFLVIHQSADKLLKRSLCSLRSPKMSRSNSKNIL